MRCASGNVDGNFTGGAGQLHQQLVATLRELAYHHAEMLKNEALNRWVQPAAVTVKEGVISETAKALPRRCR